MIGLSILIAACILAVPLFSIAHSKRCFVAQIDDLTAAIQAEAASIQALATAINNIAQPPDLQPAIDGVNSNKAAIDALTAQITPPPSP